MQYVIDGPMQVLLANEPVGSQCVGDEFNRDNQSRTTIALSGGGEARDEALRTRAAPQSFD